MKIILLFDSHELDNCYRWYELGDDAEEALAQGKYVSVTFAHPDHGEVMAAKIDVDLES